MLIKFLSENIDNFKNTEASELIETYFLDVIYNLKKYSTTYFLRKEFSKNPGYVAPIPKMIGGRWDKSYDIHEEKKLKYSKLVNSFMFQLRKLYQNYSITRNSKKSSFLKIMFALRESTKSFVVETLLKRMNFSLRTNTIFDFKYTMTISQ